MAEGEFCCERCKALERKVGVLAEQVDGLLEMFAARARAAAPVADDEPSATGELITSETERLVFKMSPDDIETPEEKARRIRRVLDREAGRLPFGE